MTIIINTIDGTEQKHSSNSLEIKPIGDGWVLDVVDEGKEIPLDVTQIQTIIIT